MYKRQRVRGLGATHPQIIEAMKTLPLEDYETGLRNNGDHKGAMDEATSYIMNSYAPSNKSSLQFIAKRPRYASSPQLDRETHDKLVLALYRHHDALMQAVGNSTVDAIDRRRGHGWLKSECSKLLPGVEDAPSSDDGKLSTATYHDIVSTLLNHYKRQQVDSPAQGKTKNFIVSQRKINALINLGSSCHYPTTYKPELYEENNA